jgi:hypothetical protein
MIIHEVGSSSSTAEAVVKLENMELAVAEAQ